MGIIFNADEAFALAEQIERNGQGFYLRAAELTKGTLTGKLLSDLAIWEKTHEELFSSMRSGLTEEEKTVTAFDPDGENALYLKAVADSHVFKTIEDPAQLLSGNESPEQIIKTALLFEKDTILFFLGLAKMVPENLGRNKVEKIIDEEIGHVAYLEKELNTIRGSVDR